MSDIIFGKKTRGTVLKYISYRSKQSKYDPLQVAGRSQARSDVTVTFSMMSC